MAPMFTYKALETLLPGKRRKTGDPEAEWYHWFDMEDITIAFSRLFWEEERTWPLAAAELLDPPTSLTYKRQLMSETTDVGELNIPYEEGKTVDELWRGTCLAIHPSLLCSLLPSLVPSSPPLLIQLSPQLLMASHSILTPDLPPSVLSALQSDPSDHEITLSCCMLSIDLQKKMSIFKCILRSRSRHTSFTLLIRGTPQLGLPLLLLH
ncbi:hypothetical protein Taro_000991 [Colocasia esculenta]|uniref:Uncharacterized protein n=1 Tax=Colocasia esculenta TaxID=4460 RepID=A0A843T8U2_COLES|nr:hypothetical protein [Colocasia esculenta]